MQLADIKHMKERNVVLGNNTAREFLELLYSNIRLEVSDKLFVQFFAVQLFFLFVFYLYKH